MSYDLALFRKEGTPLGIEEIDDVMYTFPEIEMGTQQYIFHLPDSEAVFIMDVELEEEAAENYSECLSSAPLGCIISCEISYGLIKVLRPVFPQVLAQIAEKLNLRIFDAQTNIEYGPADFTKSFSGSG